jgi:hypothetical protein
MPAKDVSYKFVLPILLLWPTSGCQHLAEILRPLSGIVFRAIVHGAIKGTTIHCEKSIEVVSDKWEIMCKIDDAMDIKYRTIKLNDEETRFEILIDKQKGEEKKTIAAPVMLVSRTRPAQLIAENSKSRLEFRVERIK